MRTNDVRLEVRDVKIVNHKDIDVVVRDFYGHEHILFPMKEKELPMLIEKTSVKLIKKIEE